MRKAIHQIKRFMLLGGMALAVSFVQAATPVVRTNISVYQTGTAPFDTTSWDGNDINTAGTDADPDNNVVRMQDSIQYRVEVSVNDSNVDDLTAEVHAINGQVWTAVPTGCKTNSADVTNQPVSSISSDKTKLFCNLGPATEGTARVFYPVALSTGIDADTGGVMLNDDTVSAEVSASADGTSNTATATSQETVVTANFRVDLQKAFKVDSVDPNTGDWVYINPYKVGPASEPGSIIEYVIKAQYVKGSMLANGVDEANGDFTASYRLVDIYTDDNANNNSPYSSGGKLYTWDSDMPACELVGDHGASATIQCNELGALFDEMGPSGSSGDGINDPAIEILLDGIDVRDPDNDGNLFEIRLNIWFDDATEVLNHQDCSPDCVNFVTNRVGVLSSPTANALGPFDEQQDSGIVSTEDASGNNLNNYNSGTESVPNEITYPLIARPSNPGVYTYNYKAFSNFLFAYKQNDQSMGAGETRIFSLNSQISNLVKGGNEYDDSTIHLCDKIDTEVFEYAGVAPPKQVSSPALHPWNNNRDYNPALLVNATPQSKWFDGKDFIKFYHSNKPHTPPSPTQADYLNALRTNTCEDDVNGDGVVNIVDKNGIESNPGNAIDWWENPEDVPGGMAAITLLRQDMFVDRDFMRENVPNYRSVFFSVNHLITSKLITASPYGNDYLPNFASSQYDPNIYGSGWLHNKPETADPANARFSLSAGTADRMTLVPTSHSIQKYTSPKGITVVKGGDIVDFIVKPMVHGLWSSTVQNTAEVIDTLPSGTTYVAGSERFSVDGGTTWLDRSAYDASNPAVTVTSAENTVGATTLTWAFGSVDSSEQLPMVKYKVLVDPNRIKGKFLNEVSLDSGSIGGVDGSGNSILAKAQYQIVILPENGLDLQKFVDQPVYSTNTPFTYDLKYKNLGAEDLAFGEFIDIFPYNNDATGPTSGLGSSREPATRFAGTHEIKLISSSNSETFYATDANPSSIPQDICHEDNQVSGYTPTAGDVCYLMYTKNGNTFAGGASAGTGVITWTACTDNKCSNVTNATAIRFTTGAIGSNAGTKTVSIELSPLGNAGGDPVLDADGKVTDASTGDIYTNNFGGRVPEISLQVISNDVSVTFVSGTIGDYVWLDANGDGVQDASEDPIVGATIALLDNAGDPIYVDTKGNVVPAGTTGAVAYTTETDANGKYLFEKLPKGSYQIKVVELPASLPSLKQTFDADGVGTGNISSTTLDLEKDPVTGVVTGVEDDTDQDFGYQQLGTIGDTIYHDKNNDGVTDSGEGLAGVTVSLQDGAGNPIYVDADGNVVPAGTVGAVALTATTDTEGKYLFEYLPAGDYTVVVDETTLPSGLAGNNTRDPDGGNDSTSKVSIVAGETNLDQDFGYFYPGSIGDTIFLDENGDGIQNPDEKGIAGVTVTLSNGATATTDANGQYLFDNLPAGDYTVTVTTGSGTPLEGFTNTADPDSSNDSTSAVTLGEGENNLDQDFGYQAPEPLGSIGDTIFLDENGDGVQNPDEKGIAGVTVTLSNGATATTDANGQYLFDNLPAGDYTVTVTTGSGTPLEGFTNTADPDGSNDSTSAVTLGAGENNLDQDFGYQAPEPLGSIGDTIFLDANGDGIQNPDEKGIAGVTVTLSNGATATTDANGQYLFDNLPAGDYTVTVTTGSGTPLEGFTNTADPDSSNDSTSTVTLGVGENNLDQDFGYQAPEPLGSIGDTIFLDENGDGIQNPDEKGIAGVTVTLSNGATATTDANGRYLFDNLPAGDYTVTVTTGSGTPLKGFTNTADPDGSNDSTSAVTLGVGENNLDQDFGYQAPEPLGSIGDTIFLDANGDGIQNPDEKGIAGVTVTLSNGATATTDANGRYLFDNLPAGDYTVTVTTGSGTPLEGFTNTADPDGSNDSTSAVTLGVGENNLDQDFGYSAIINAVDDVYTTDVDTPVVINPLSGDSSDTTITEINSVTLTGKVQSIPVDNGTVEIDDRGTITFVPNKGYTGSTSFTYVITDKDGNTATATEFITIVGNNQPAPKHVPATSWWSLLILVGLMGVFARRRR